MQIRQLISADAWPASRDAGSA